MRRTALPSTLDHLFLPDVKRSYVVGWREYRFRPEAAGYD